MAFKRPSGYVIPVKRFRATGLADSYECIVRDSALFPTTLTNRIDLMRLSGNIGSKLDMFHEQLPLPVPCYDLVLVTEFAVVLREAVLRAPPAPLT